MHPLKFNLQNSILILIILFIAVLIYYSSLFNDFTNWDDSMYITENYLIQSLNWANIKLMFSSFYAANYHPLTLLSFAFQYKIANGPDPFIFHLFNLIIHLLNVILVFIFTLQLFRNNNISFITAILFAIHPMHVESVAWISAHKDLLYSFFFISSLIFYNLYYNSLLKNQSDKHFIKNKYYITAFLLFLLSLMSKSMAVTLPAILFLLDFFLKRSYTFNNFNSIFQVKILNSKFKIHRNAFLDKIPFFTLSIIFSTLTLLSQKQAIELSHLPDSYNFFDKFLVFCYSLSIYLIKFFYPHNLSSFYAWPHKADKDFIINQPEFLLTPLLILSLIIFIIILFKKKNRISFFSNTNNQNSTFQSSSFSYFISFPLLFFIITILPVLQLLPVGRAILAERYTYIPYLGFCFIFALFFSYVFSNLFSFNKCSFIKYISHLLLIFYFLFLSYTSFQRTKVWTDSINLWSDALKNNPDESFCYLSRGMAYKKANNYFLALQDYNKAIYINPGYAMAYNNRSVIYAQITQDYKAALADCNKAISLEPSYAKAYNNRGSVFALMKNYYYAINDYKKALNLNPYYAEAYYNLGNTYIALNDFNNACFYWKKAIKLNYKIADHLYNKYCQ